ncbi:MAG TPA: PadR family transcriptional regulator [Spirochaetia bacterium]|nr:PadR family transcriptional regulator [Spirochaetia bacterium]
MSAIDLVLLGLLVREEQSAYDLARQIETHDLGEVVRLSIPAVYKNVKSLHERGYLAAREERRGEMPERTVYALTENGRDYFYSLMEKYAAEKVRYRFDFNSVIMNLDKVPKKRREKLLALVKERLEKSGDEAVAGLAAWQQKLPMTGAILRQVELVNRALLAWINAVTKEL